MGRADHLERNLARLSVSILLVASFLIANVLSESNHDILLGGKTNIQLKFYDQPIRLAGNGAGNVTFKVFTYDTVTHQRNSSNVLWSLLQVDRSHFVPQPDNGIAYHPDNMVTTSVNVTSPRQTGFLVAIYENGKQFALGFLNPFQYYETFGFENITLVSSDFQVVGNITVQYLVIRPITAFDPQWANYSHTDDLYFVGHRGTGHSHRTDLLGEHYLENTIAAFNFACSKGAEMIELDVQLTSDKIPIIYHDFFVKSFLIERNSATRNLSMHIPVKDLSLKQLQEMATNYMPRKDHDKDNESFETLENVLKKVKAGCGINVEIKYPQLRRDLTWDGAVGLELNEYVDRILEVLYKHAHDRKIVITSFHPDLCSMVQYKQNRFRVAFLTAGTVTNPKSKDPRDRNFENGVAFVQSSHIKGLSLLVDDLVHEPKHIDLLRTRGLALYIWGDSLLSYKQIIDYKNKGVNAAICNKIDLIMAQSHGH